MLDYRTIYKDIAPKEQIVSGALSYARARVGGAGIVTLDVLKEGALEVVKSIALDKLRPGVETLLANAVMGFTILNGERPVLDDRGDSDNARMEVALFEQRVGAPWRDKFDDWMISQIGSDLARAIGPSCMGEHFTDSDVDDVAVRNKVAIEIAERLVESAMPTATFLTVDARGRNVHGERPSLNKTLSAAGIVDADLLPYTAATGAAVATSEEKETMSLTQIDEPTARARVEQIVQSFALQRGAADFDPLVLGELLGGAFDDDEFIAIGAIERLGGAVADRPFFLAYLMAAPLEVHSNTMTAALNALATGQVVEPPKPVKAKKIKVQAGVSPPSPPAAHAAPLAPPPLAPPGGGGAAVPTPTALAPGGAGTPLVAPSDGDYADVVKLWREHGKDSDDTIGKTIGVSRAQVSNIGSGKSKLPLSQEKRGEILSALTKKIDGLQQAIALLG